MRLKNLASQLLIAASLTGALTLFTGCESTVEKYRKQGISLYNNGEYDQSLATLKTALSADQFDAKSNTYAGLIEYRQGNYQQASYYFKVALQSDPSQEEALSGLVAAYIKLDKPDLALDFLERRSAMADQVKDPRWEKTNVKRPYEHQTEENLYVGKTGARRLIGHTYEKLGDYDNALLYYQKASDMAPRDVNPLLDIAGLYDKTGNKAAARDYLIRAYNIDPSAPGLTDLMTKDNVIINDVIGTPLSNKQ